MNTIVITGVDGSGKTTHVNLLKKVLPNVNTMSVWDIVANPEYKEWSIYNGFPPQVEKYVMQLPPLSRTFFIFHAFDFAYKKAMEKEVDYLILDGYWYKYLSVELAMGTNDGILDFLIDLYEEPDLTFYLDLPISKIKERKPVISQYESGTKEGIDYDNFLKIQHVAKDFIENMIPEEAVYIDAMKSIDEIHHIIMKHIAHQLL